MKPKVLIIDDNERNVDLMKDFIESWGYQTLVAYQGREALDLARNKHPDIIVLDVMLPGISGFEVCQILRRDEETWNIPIILVTALSSVEDRINGFNAGCDSFLVKPINYKELKAILKNQTRRCKMQAYMEKQNIILEKYYYILKKILPAEVFVEDAKIMDFLEGTSRILGQDGENLYILKNVVRFYGAFKNVVVEENDVELATKLFAGMNTQKWLRPILDYCCDYEGVDQIKNKEYLEAKGLFRATKISKVYIEYIDCLKETSTDFKKAYELLKSKENLELEEAVMEAIEKNIKNCEMRKNITLHLSKKIKTKNKE